MFNCYFSLFLFDGFVMAWSVPALTFDHFCEMHMLGNDRLMRSILLSVERSQLSSRGIEDVTIKMLF